MNYGESKIGTPWRGYYITAYGIALKHGFKGTEEEWLASLHGQDGRSIEIRYNEGASILEWRYAGEEQWHELLSLEQLQTQIVAQTLAQAEAAKAGVEAAQRKAEEAAANAMGFAAAAQQSASGAKGSSANAQKFKEEAGRSAQRAAASENAASGSMTAAEKSAGDAIKAASAASEDAALAQSWAVGGTGKRPGEHTNNAKYWAEEAKNASGGGVMSFNGRSGSVVPLMGDYNLAMVGGTNDNKLRNWYFKAPINQRNMKSGVPWGDRQYGLDGWLTLYNNVVYWDGAAIVLPAEETKNSLVEQRLEEDFTNQQVAISALLDDNTLITTSGTTDISTTADKVIVDFKKENGYYRFRVWNMSNVQVKVIACKVEFGPVQTLAHKENGVWILNEIPDVTMETLKCQRFFRRFPPNWSLGGVQPTTVVFEYGLNPPMRTTPAVTIQNPNDLSNAIDDGTQPLTPSGLVIRQSSASNVEFYFTNITANSSSIFLQRYIDVVADL